MRHRKSMGPGELQKAHCLGEASTANGRLTELDRTCHSLMGFKNETYTFLDMAKFFEEDEERRGKRSLRWSS
jgi:hypothetical protein